MGEISRSVFSAKIYVAVGCFTDILLRFESFKKSKIDAKVPLFTHVKIKN